MLIYLLLEHKSEIDRHIALQLLSYLANAMLGQLFRSRVTLTNPAELVEKAPQETPPQACRVVLQKPGVGAPIRGDKPQGAAARNPAGL